jgi:hypothetical protein
MCHVHCANGQRPNHPAGGVLVHSVGRQYARAAAYIVLIMAHALPRKQPRDINIVCTTDIMALGVHPGVTGISCFLPFVPGPTCRGSVYLCVPPLSYKREHTALQGKLTQTQLRLTLSHSLKLTSSYKLSSSIHHTVEQCIMLRRPEPL